MKRIIIICEGETEQTFCKNMLATHFQSRDTALQAPLIKHSKGGIVKWPLLKQQIETHLKGDPTAFVTTFIDYYGLCSEHHFPSWKECEDIIDRNDRMNALEKVMAHDIQQELRHRFIPYVQLHEFEGLLFNDIDVFYSQIPNEDIVGEKELKDTFATFNNPEMINNAKETSPSHRLERIIRGYNKVVYGDILADAIGLLRIRSKAPRFDAWIEKLSNL